MLYANLHNGPRTFAPADCGPRPDNRPDLAHDNRPVISPPQVERGGRMVDCVFARGEWLTPEEYLSVCRAAGGRVD